MLLHYKYASRIKMNRDDIQTNINSIQFRGADIWMIVWYQSVSCCSQRLLLWFISSSTSLTPIRVYSLGIIVQTLEYFINKRLSKYLLSIILMPCVPKAQGIALMGSTLENAGVELCCTSPVLDKTRHNYCVGH